MEPPSGARPVFLLGTGRSGTHLVGETISSHPAIEGRIEDPETFPLVTRIATTQDLAPPSVIEELLAAVIAAYGRILASSKAELVLEKSHPNIWMAERLAAAFPTARFVGVLRGPHATVASMLRHDGVLAWYQKLPLDRPNRFLGIDDSRVATFATLPVEQRCALRWMSHRRELERLEPALGSRFHRVSYEAFLEAPDRSLRALAQFLGVRDDFGRPRLKAESLERWREDLTAEQIHNIDELLATEGLTRSCSEPVIPPG